MITSNRKLQAEIDKVLKKVEEGTEEFDDTLNKVHEASNPSQKEKHENELKREIKKLQRFREQIKIWQTSSEIKNKTALAAPREQIENRMKLFKDLEKEAKTKPYSKEGLSRSTKTLSQNAATAAAASSATAAASGAKSISKSTSALSTRKSAGTSAPAGGAKKRGRKSRAAAAAGGTAAKGEEGEENAKRPTKGMQVCRWLDACVDAIDAEIAVLEQQAASAAETTTTTVQKKRKGAQKARDSTKVIEALRAKHRDNIVKVRALVAEHHIKPSLVEVYLKEDLDALLNSFASRGGSGVTLNDEDGEAEIEYPFLISSASDSFVEDEELEEDEIENVEEEDDEYDDDEDDEVVEEEEEDGYDDEDDEYDDVDDVDDEREEGEEEEEVDGGNSDNNDDDDDDDEVVTSNSDESGGVSRSGSATNEPDEANTDDNNEKAKANTENPATAPETASTNGKPKTAKQEEKKPGSDEDDIQTITSLNPQQQQLQQQQQYQQRITLNQSPTKPQQQRYTRSTQYHSRQQPPPPTTTTNPAPIGIMHQQQQQPRTRLFTTDEHIPSNSIQISTSPQAGDAAPRNTPSQLLRQSAGTQFAQFNTLSRRILRAKERYLPQPYTPAEPVTEKDGPVPAWFPRKPLSVLSSQGVVSRMPEETLQFAFYLSQNQYQQMLAAKALGKLGWRFHTGKRLWVLSKGEPAVEKGGECEVGDYYYYDWEDLLEKKVMSGFKFEYKFFDK